MSHSLARHVDELPRKACARPVLRGETDSKVLADADLGPVVERVIALSGLNREQLAFALGYADGSSIARWVRNLEAPQFARLWAVRTLRAAIVQALAERSDDVEVETTVRVRRARLA